MATAQAMQGVAQLEAAVQSVLTYQTSFEKELPELDKLKSIRVEEFIAPANRSTARRQDKEDTTPPVVQIDKLGRSGDIDLRESSSTKTYLSNVGGFLDQFVYFSNDSAEKYKRVKDAISLANSSDPAEQFSTKDKYTQLRDDLKYLLSLIHAEGTAASRTLKELTVALRSPNPNLFEIVGTYRNLQADYLAKLNTSGNAGDFKSLITAAFASGERAFADLGTAAAASQAATQNAKLARRRLDEKKLLDMLVDDLEDKFIELVDGTRAHTANVDNYLKGLATALDDDFNTQFYQPAFSKIRSLAVGWDVQLGQIESTTVLTNNRTLAKVSPAASMEFDLPQRSIFVKEAFKGAKAAMDDYGALLNDPTFLSTAKLFAGVPPSAGFGGQLGLPAVKNVLPGLPSSADELIMAQAGGKPKEFGSALEALIPDPAVYKFETGTGYEIRPVVNPDGQAVVFGFDYMYTSDVREPVRADEKHLGKVKRHFVHTDVQLSNFEMREVSKYWVALKASRTSQGVQLLQDIPGVGALFRPAPSAQSSLQQNLIYSQATIFPTLFDLMGLRYAPAVADVDAQFMKTEEFVVRGRREFLKAHIFGYGASRVDDALRILYGERRPDLYRTQQTIPWVHPNGYQGPGLRQRDSQLQEGYEPTAAYPPSRYAPGRTPGTTGAPADGGFGPPPGVMPYPPGAVVPTPGVDYQSFPPFTGATIPPPAGVPGAPAVTAARPAVPIEKTAQPLGTTVTPGLPPTPVRPGAPTVSAPPRPVAAFPSPSRP